MGFHIGEIKNLRYLKNKQILQAQTSKYIYIPPLNLMLLEDVWMICFLLGPNTYRVSVLAVWMSRARIYICHWAWIGCVCWCWFCCFQYVCAKFRHPFLVSNINCTLPGTNGSHLKIDGLKMKCPFLLGRRNLAGCTVDGTNLAPPRMHKEYVCLKKDKLLIT